MTPPDRAPPASPPDPGAGTDAYARAGVDIDRGAAVVEAVKPLAAATDRPGTMGGLGGFGALFDPRAAGYTDPILVAATDGVGTKLKVAIAAGRHEAVGIDLVAMCVNDLVVQGAEPLFFLDYYATARLDPAVARAVIAGIAEGCREAGCALIGGETAEMPGLYAAGDYDLAGFAVGAAERGHLIDGSGAAPGDAVLGLASSGVHANGFSLVRRIVEDAGAGWHDPAPFPADPGMDLARALLTPTRVYVRACLGAIAAGGVRALAHITGGGLVENLPRVLPAGVGARLDAGAWPLPGVFAWLKRAGNLDDGELARTFNAGLGMLVVAAPEREAAVADALRAAGETVYRVGRLVEGSGIRIDGTADAWRG